jgi:DNA-binding protein YbaB
MAGSPLSEQLTQSIAALREQQDRVAQVRRELAGATVSVTARDRSVTVEMGSQGELRELRFHSEDYRAMPAAELSALLIQLCNQARQQMAEKVADALAPLSSFGAALRRSMTGGSDWEEALEPLRAARGGGSAPGSEGADCDG